MKNFYIILFVLLGVKTYAQEFYITSFEYFSELNTIDYVDSNFNVTALADIFVNGDQILDIAYAPNGKLYGTTPTKIIEIDLQNASYNVVYTFPVQGQYNSAVCNADNQIVVLEYYYGHLITIDLTTFTEVSDVELNESSPGDLTYYKGNLIFESALSGNILGYDGNSLKTVACGVNYNTGERIEFWGFSNYTDSCENNFVYGFDQVGYVYRFDIELNTTEEVGNLHYYLQPINGATTINEYTASACPLQELEEMDCNLRITDQQLSNLLFYPNPVKDVLHIGNLNRQEEMFYTLYSLEGKKLSEDVLTPEINFSKISVGIYFMTIYNKSKTLSTTKKVIKE